MVFYKTFFTCSKLKQSSNKDHTEKYCNFTLAVYTQQMFMLNFDFFGEILGDVYTTNAIEIQLLC